VSQVSRAAIERAPSFCATDALSAEGDFSGKLALDGKMEILIDSLRNGLRFAKRGSAVAAVTVIILALGIGVSTAIFSILYAVSYSPLPYKNPEQLVTFLRTALTTVTFEGRTVTNVAPLPLVPGPDFLNWKKQSDLFSALGAGKPYLPSARSGDQTVKLEGYEVTPEFFKALDVEPLAGRLFTAADNQPGGDHVVVLGPGFASHGAWTGAVKVGGVLMLNNEEYAVIGSLPPSFRMVGVGVLGAPPKPDLFIPVPVAELEKVPASNGLMAGTLTVIGRLKPDMGIAQAQAEMTAISARLAKANPALDEGVGVEVKSLKSQEGQSSDLSLKLLLVGVGIVLLIACVNIAVLTLTQGARRQREIVIRHALGAARGRIVGQLFSESLLLGLAGGAGGILLAFWLKDALASEFPPASLPLIAPPQINWQVLVFALAVSVAAAAMFGMIPALQLSLISSSELLKKAAHGAGGGVRSGWPRNAFVVCEVTLAFALLIVCSLSIGGIRNQILGSLGFNPNGVLQMDVRLAPAAYPSVAAREGLYRGMLARLDASRMSESSALSAGPFFNSVAGADQSLTALAFKSGPQTLVYFASPDYFRTLQIPLLRGRPFAWSDYGEKAAVAIVSQVLAASLWPNQDPIGKHITTTFPPEPLEVIGVASNASPVGVAMLKTMPQAYLPQLPLEATLQVRTAGPPTGVMAALHDLAAAEGPGVKVAAPITMQQALTEQSRPFHYIEVILGFFGLMALLLATVGVFAVTAYSVTQRTHEIGVRMALGAQPARVLRDVMRQGVRLSLYGIGIGLLVALGLGKVLMHFLRGYTYGSLGTYFGVALLLLAVAVAACYIPARRAMRVDPMVALRYE
jgi:putative ABC transport system permease protein